MNEYSLAKVLLILIYKNMNQHQKRVILELLLAICFSWLYIPHFLCYALMDRKDVNADLDRWKSKTYYKLPRILLLLYKLHNDAYFRVIFYHRIGPVLKFIISWYRPGASTFRIRPSSKIGGGMYAPHCCATELNATRIGINFTVLQCTTIGKKAEGIPTIGDNVELGANVNIIGRVTIGDNTTVGAGSVVTKDVPPNTVVVGVPAKVIRIK